MFETKVHYKSYKAGKQWLYMAIGVTSLCAGLAVTVPANAADNTPATAESTTVVKTDSSTPAKDASAQPAPATKTATPVTESEPVDDSDASSSADSDAPVATETDDQTPAADPAPTNSATQDPTVPDVTPTPSKTPGTTVDPNATTDAPQAITNNPDGAYKNYNTGSDVTGTLYLTGSNDQGTSTSLTSNNNVHSNVGVASVVDPTVKDLTLHVHVHNEETQDNYTYVWLNLPPFFQYYTQTSKVTADFSNLLDQLPSNQTVCLLYDRFENL